MSQIPISSLTSQDFDPIPFASSQSSSIYGLITLLWPYSSSRRSLAFLLSHPDFRQRYSREQVRIRLKGPAAEAFAKLHVEITDEVYLSLKGAHWVSVEYIGQASQNTPGKSVDGELEYKWELHAQVKRAGNTLAELLVNEEPRFAEHDAVNHWKTPISNQKSRSNINDDHVISLSPNFHRKARISGGSDVDSAIDPFIDDDDLLHEFRIKRPRTSWGGHAKWRLADRIPSPDKEVNMDHLIDNHQIENSEMEEPIFSVDHDDRSESPFILVESTEPFDTNYSIFPKKQTSKLQLFKDPITTPSLPPSLNSSVLQEKSPVLSHLADEGIHEIDYAMKSTSNSSTLSFPGKPSSISLKNFQLQIEEIQDSNPSDEQVLLDREKELQPLVHESFSSFDSALVEPVSFHNQEFGLNFAPRQPSQTSSISETLQPLTFNSQQQSSQTFLINKKTEKSKTVIPETIEINDDGENIGSSTTLLSRLLRDKRENVNKSNPFIIDDSSEEEEEHKEKQNEQTLSNRHRNRQISQILEADENLLRFPSIQRQTSELGSQNDPIEILDDDEKEEEEEEEEEDEKEEGKEEEIDDEEDQIISPLLPPKYPNSLPLFQSSQSKNDESLEISGITSLELEGIGRIPETLYSQDDKQYSPSESQHAKGEYMTSQTLQHDFTASSLPLDNVSYTQAGTYKSQPMLNDSIEYSSQHADFSILEPSKVILEVSQTAQFLPSNIANSLFDNSVIDAKVIPETITSVTVDETQLLSKTKAKDSEALIPDSERTQTLDSSQKKSQIHDNVDKNVVESLPKETSNDGLIKSAEILETQQYVLSSQDSQLLDLISKAHESKQVRGLRTTFSYYTPLPHLISHLNPAHPFDSTLSVIAVVSRATSKPERAGKGARDYMTKFRITQPNGFPSSTLVSIFRPFAKALPKLERGCVILLADFEVYALKGGTVGIRSRDGCGWCIWKTGKSGKQEEIGPPVEFGEEERDEADRLLKWWG